MSHFPRLTPDLGGGGDRGIISTNSPALQWEKIWWGYWRRGEHLTPAPAPHTPPWDWQSSSLTLQCIFKWSSRFCGFSQDNICKEALVIRHCSKSREMTECNCSSVKLSSPDWTLPLLLWPNNSSYSILSLLLLILILFSFDIIKTMNLLSPSPFYLCNIYLVWGVLIEDPGPWTIWSWHHLWALMGSLAKYIFSSPNCGLVWKIKLSSYARLSVCMSRLRGETKAVPGCVSHFRGGRRTALLVNITRICKLYFRICIVFDWAHFRAGRAFLPVDITAITDYPHFAPHQNLTLIYLGKVHQTLLFPD